MAVLLCFIYAALDEFHQYFVAGRTASVSDVFVDAIGFCFAIAVCGIVSTIHQKKKHTATTADKP